MKFSNLFGKTQKNISTNAESISHQLMLRAGFILQIAAGVYAYMPIAYKAFRKIENIIFNGDDYEIIFTSHKKNRSLINKYAKSKKLKIQRIGKILKKHQDSCILKGNKKFRINKNLGYTHQF